MSASDTLTAPVRLTISQVCSRVPGARGARRLAPSTVTRWILAGCPARDGTRVKLRATRAGSRWLVAPADLDQFFEQLAGDVASSPPPVRTPTERNRDSERAVANLAARGVKT